MSKQELLARIDALQAELDQSYSKWVYFEWSALLAQLEAM